MTLRYRYEDEWDAMVLYDDPREPSQDPYLRSLAMIVDYAWIPLIPIALVLLLCGG